ncbi:glycoside hydrolase [Aspergillus ambiguus]|uniref:glycoside hydrolase n=1 Tax=Aspergillus ambiguus TaxID=176160 RepID=UPI003CCC910A
MRLLSLLPLAMASLAGAKSTFFSALNACPAPCENLNHPTGWTTYNRVNRLSACNETMLVDFALHNPLDNPKTTTKLYACTTTGDKDAQVKEVDTSSCVATREIEVSMDFATSGGSAPESSSKVVAALRQVQNRLRTEKDCTRSAMFGYAQKAVVGLFIGGKVQHDAVADSIIEKLIKQIEAEGPSERLVLQHCGAASDYVVGIAADLTGGLPAVQHAVQQWSKAECVTGYNNTSEWSELTLTVSGTRVNEKQSGWRNFARNLVRRDTCEYTQVVKGDLCTTTLPEKCGISQDEFDKVHEDDPEFCTNLKEGQIVCCTEGDLPDLSPKPNDDGTCASYTTIMDDNCEKIAAANTLDVSEIEDFNKETWGWTGCGDLNEGTKMCLSEGDPPMPEPYSNAVCGPQVPGTERPTDGTKLEDLNPCPLNACCNIWGQCGITEDFCTVSESETGAPGTSAPEEDGCISNCGTDIVNKELRDDFIYVAYFEAWNYDRPCMNMDVSRVDTDYYSHIHFAFANITQDYEVDISQIELQFQMFRKMTNIKRILSFGGWSFSTALDTYPIFRQGVSDADRQKFADNVAKFIVDNDLDGVDFDWEYPGAPDIPGIPAGSEEDGANYVKFLKMVREALPDDKSLSIAAPASFWYLKGFDPLSDFEPLIDYMIYMTYDLHGQWDYDSPFANPGCEDGNCLRSHVNFTETATAMSMVTKAGMPTSKVIMGTSMYGRSFKMEEAGCTGPMCKFVGPESAAKKGRCTQTAGYISEAEIKEIIENNPSAQTSFDAVTQSDYLVYDETEWVAYMSKDTREFRILQYLTQASMGGHSDWAVDLENLYTATAGDYLPCNATYETLDEIKEDVDDIQDHCIEKYIIPILSRDLKDALEKYDQIMEDDYDGKFDSYADYIKEHIPNQLENYMMDHGNDYFTCIYEGWVDCCADCGMSCPDDCNDTCENSGRMNITAPCPNLMPDPGRPGNGSNVYWQLNDQEAFFKDVGDEYGIDGSWIIFAPYVNGLNSCGPDDGDEHECGTWWFDFPTRDPTMKVPNPKDVIENSLTNLTIVRDMLVEAEEEIMYYLYSGSTSDVVTASEYPVFMTQFAVEQMEKVADLGEEIEEQEKKERILNFVMAALMLIPAVGEAVGSLGLATIGRVIILTGALGDAAFTVYGIVEDPKSAILALFTSLVGFRGASGFTKGAQARRRMSTKEASAIKAAFSAKSDLLASVRKTCKL